MSRNAILHHLQKVFIIALGILLIAAQCNTFTRDVSEGDALKTQSPIGTPRGLEQINTPILPTTTPVPTNTPTPTDTLTVTPSLTATPVSSIFTDTPTVIPSLTATATLSPTPTNTPTATPTSTDTPTITLSPTAILTPAEAVVMAYALTLRSGPGMIYSPIGYLRNGQILDFQGRIASNEWVQVTPVNGSNKKGWVFASPEFVRINVDLNNIPIVEPPPTPTVTPSEAIVIATNGVELRDGPATDNDYYHTIATLPKGTALTVLRPVVNKPDWIKISANLESTATITGYVMTAPEFIQINVDLGDIPPMYEFGPILFEPKPWTTYPVGETVRFIWEEFPLEPDQIYSIIVLRDDFPPEKACIHIQAKMPEVFLTLDCPAGSYHWLVLVATKLPEGSESQWREDSERNHISYFGIGEPHKNAPSDGGNGGSGGADGSGTGHLPSDDL